MLFLINYLDEIKDKFDFAKSNLDIFFLLAKFNQSTKMKFIFVFFFTAKSNSTFYFIIRFYLEFRILFVLIRFDMQSLLIFLLSKIQISLSNLVNANSRLWIQSNHIRSNTNLIRFVSLQLFRLLVLLVSFSFCLYSNGQHWADDGDGSICDFEALSIELCCFINIYNFCLIII